MKKTSLILLIIIISVFVIATPIVIAATLLTSDNDTTLESALQSADDLQTDAPLTRIYKTSDGKTVELSYLETVDSIAYDDYDVYVDDNGNRYSYDFDGNLKGILYANSNSTELSQGNGEKNGDITRDDAIEIAEKHAKNMFGSRFDGLKYYSDRVKSTGNYSITFAETYGKDDFIRGKYCVVVVRKNGEVVNCSMYSEYDLKDFNIEILNDLTKEDVDKYISESCEELLSGVKTIEIKSYELVEKDGKFCIQSSIDVTASDYPAEDIIEKYRIDFYKTSGISFSMYHYYPLEN